MRNMLCIDDAGLEGLLQWGCHYQTMPLPCAALYVYTPEGWIVCALSRFQR